MEPFGQEEIGQGGGRLHADCPARKIDLGLGGVDQNLQHQDLEVMDVVMTLTPTLMVTLLLPFPPPLFVDHRCCRD